MASVVMRYWMTTGAAYGAGDRRALMFLGSEARSPATKGDTRG